MIRTKIILPQFILFVLFYTVEISAKRSPSRLLNATSTCPVYLTISSKSKSFEESQIVINWGPACKDPPKFIGLYSKDPSIFNDEPRAYIETNSSQKGVYDTNVTIGQFKLPDGWNRNDFLSEPPKVKGQCLPFFVAAFDGDMTLKSLDCLKIQPTWMNEINRLKDLPLKDMFIPGTHCSGCYYRNSNTQNVLVEKFGVTQNFDVWTQLVFGIRYLDISVGYNEDDQQSEKFWAVNENLFITPISVIIGDIRRFISLANQIVIIDFNAFPIGFTPLRHVQFLMYLENELGHIAFPNDRVSRSYDLTINKMEEQGKLLIIYNQPDFSRVTDIVWPSWKRFSTEDLRTTEMREYMRKVFSKKYDGGADEQIGWSFFGRQGVESSYTSNSSLLTTRERAYRVNHDLSVWLGGVWSLSANVVALDYFDSTNLIDMAIHINRHKSTELAHLVFFDVEVK